MFYRKLRRFSHKVKSLFYDIKNGLSNIFRWIPTIWELRDWDAVYLYLIIAKHLKHVEDCIENYGSTVTAKKDARNIRIAKNLAKRLYENDYPYGDIKEAKTAKNYKRVKKLREYDKKLLFLYLKKYTDSWWD